jgi:hypothetical protein
MPNDEVVKIVDAGSSVNLDEADVSADVVREAFDMLKGMSYRFCSIPIRLVFLAS